MGSVDDNDNFKKIHCLAENKLQSIINDNLKKELEKTIHNLAENVVQDILQKNSIKNNNKVSISNHCNHEKSQQQKNYLQDRVFTPRNSILTDVFENPHVKTIYNICITILIFHLLNTLIYDFLDTGRINVGARLIVLNFGKFDIVILIWICMQTIALLPYIFLQQWAKSRDVFKNNGTSLKVYDFIWLCFLVVYQIGFLMFGSLTVFKYDLATASSFVVLLENVRFIMKIHAYICTVSRRVLEKPDLSNVTLPKYHNYIYFMFAPTLIYRDSYPRSTHTDWKKVIKYLIEMTVTIFFTSLLFERYFLTIDWKSFISNSEPLELKYFIQILFQSMVPGLLFFISGFYMLLHCWHNAFAEMLKFSDKRFYMDWWTKSDYGSFYRTWNIVVYDWLHTYIYKEVIRISGKRWIASQAVFIISAIIHELILIVSFRFFYPALFFLFVIVSIILLYSVKNANPTVGNIILWLSLLTGNGILWIVYGSEHFARMNCPQVIESYWHDLLVPRSWFCQNIVLSKN